LKIYCDCSHLKILLFIKSDAPEKIENAEEKIVSLPFVKLYQTSIDFCQPPSHFSTATDLYGYAVSSQPSAKIEQFETLP